MKELLKADTVLAYYDPVKPTRLYVDHGPEGLGSTLTQGHAVPGQRELQYRPIIYHSRSLTKAEKGYGKIEGESLPVLAGIKVNSMYLYGTEFEVVNDHMPVVTLYQARPAPVRVEKHRSKLRSFRFRMIHQPGRTGLGRKEGWEGRRAGKEVVEQEPL